MDMRLLLIYFDEAKDYWQFAPGTEDGIAMADHAHCSFSNTMMLLCPKKHSLVAGILGAGGRFEGWKLSGMFAGFTPLNGNYYCNVLLVRGRGLVGEQHQDTKPLDAEEPRRMTVQQGIGPNARRLGRGLPHTS